MLNNGRQFAQPFVEPTSDLADTAVDICICAARHTMTVDLPSPLVGQMSARSCLRPTNGARHLSGLDHDDSSPGFVVLSVTEIAHLGGNYMDLSVLPDERATRDPLGPAVADDLSDLNNAEFLDAVQRAAGTLRSRGV